MAFMRELCSEAMLFRIAWQSLLAMQNSQKNYEVGLISESSGSWRTTYLKVFRNSARFISSIFFRIWLITFLNSLYTTRIFSQSLEQVRIWVAMAAAVGKFRGVVMLVIAFSIRSGKGLDKAMEPLSPTTNILQALRSPPLIIALISLTMLEFVPPHRPLSVVMGTNMVFFTVKGCFFLWRQVSLLMILSTEPTPKNLAFSSRPTSCFILDAATIFMAFVIFLMDSTAFIRILISFKLLVANEQLLLKRSGEQA